MTSVSCQLADIVFVACAVSHGQQASQPALQLAVAAHVRIPSHHRQQTARVDPHPEHARHHRCRVVLPRFARHPWPALPEPELASRVQPEGPVRGVAYHSRSHQVAPRGLGKSGEVVIGHDVRRIQAPPAGLRRPGPRSAAATAPRPVACRASNRHDESHGPYEKAAACSVPPARAEGPCVRPSAGSRRAVSLGDHLAPACTASAKEPRQGKWLSRIASGRAPYARTALATGLLIYAA